MARTSLYVITIVISFMCGYWVNGVNISKYKDETDKTLLEMKKALDGIKSLDSVLDISIYLQLLNKLKENKISIEKDYLQLIKERLTVLIERVELSLKNKQKDGTREHITKVVEKAKGYVNNDL